MKTKGKYKVEKTITLSFGKKLEMVKAQKWVLAKQFNGFPKKEDLELVTESLPMLKDGEILIKATSISVDPYQRAFAGVLSDRSVMPGSQIATVIESKNTEYPVGTDVMASVGWRDKTILNPSVDKHAMDGVGLFTRLEELPDMGNLDTSYGLGAMGMPGITAYFGLTHICEAKPGEVVLINAAAGAVGSLAGQIAKIMGCTVIGFAGTDKKVQWLKEIGYDYAFNYKTQDIDESLKSVAPEGVDCYFDSVGGIFTAKVLSSHMKLYGRIYSCGSIDSYNGTPSSGPYPFVSFLTRQLKMEGALLTKWKSQWPKTYKILYKWIVEGKLKYREHVTNGFENVPKALFGVLKGENIGKAVVKV